MRRIIFDAFTETCRKTLPPDKCWSWPGYIARTGYGVFSKNGTRWLVHRYAHTVFKGPIPDGLQIDHLCRNRACCNPEHLEAVTLKENLRRGERATKTHCANGHSLSGDNLRIRNGTGWRTCRQCCDDRMKKPVNGDHVPRTHCKRGHAMTPENTYVTKRGTHVCITCRKAAVAAYWERQRHKSTAHYK